MTRVMIRGSAAVLRGDNPVTDAAVLRALDGVVYDDERFADYVWGRPGVGAPAADLEPGGPSGSPTGPATTSCRPRRSARAAGR